jgi:hypothetical protein
VKLGQSTWAALEPRHWVWACAAVAIVGAIVLALLRQRPWGLRALCAFATFLGSAAASWLVIGTLEWVRLNEYVDRYVVTSVVFAALGLCSVAVTPLLAWRKAAKAGPWVAATLVFASALWAYGPPSLRKAREGLSSQGRWTQDLIDSRATHVAGTYWNVWPAVFHTRWTLHERGNDRVVWGLTHRSVATERHWNAVPLEQTRIAALKDDPEAEQWMKHHGYRDLELVEDRPTLHVFRPRAREPQM